MSSSLAIAAVTATLQRMLTSTDGGLLAHLPPDLPAALNLDSVSVTTKPPDKARASNANTNQVNIYLYHTAPNASLRNMDMQRKVRPGESAQPPVALTLHYLFSFYGQDDDDKAAHILLGQAMRIFNDNAVLDQTAIKNALAGNDLHEQLERVRLTQQPQTVDEMSKLWTAFQTQHRISATYQADVVLIESNLAARTPLPVLTHGKDDRGVISQPDLVPQFPTIEELRLVDPVTNELLATKGRFSFEIGDRIAVLGHHFAGAEGDGTKVNVTIRLITSRLNKPQDIVVAPADRTDRRINFQIGPANIPAGLYELSTLVAPIGSTDEPPATVEVPLLLAPKLVGLPGAVARTNVVDGLGDATIAVTCSPDILPEQTVTLALGDVQLQAAPRAAATTALSFTGKKIGAGSFRVRLRVDGVDSHIVDFTDPKKPQFIESQKVTIT
jgi:Pvc16 N-terminal domain